LALSVSLEHLSKKYDNKRALTLSKALDEATTKFLLNNKSPSRKVGELDNRGSHFYLTLYWAEALANQSDDQDLKERFTSVSKEMLEKESVIVDELNGVQGKAMDIGGYFKPDPKLASQAMRPSETLNKILDSI